MPGLTAESRALMLEWQEISARAILGYVDAWQAGRLSLADFERLFKTEVRDLYVAAAWTARGSVEATSQADYGRVGRMLRDQYGYAHDFFQEIERGELSLAQIKARTGLYVAGSSQAIEATGAAQAGLPRLPAIPGDGSTRCRTNCKCTWQVQAVQNGFDCTWQLHTAEHCPDCRQRAADWNPLRVRFGKIVS